MQRFAGAQTSSTAPLHIAARSAIFFVALNASQNQTVGAQRRKHPRKLRRPKLEAYLWKS